jgi:long-chain acyl-CoA synthetase
MPMSHSSALNSQMVPLIELGGRLVLMERFDAAALLDTIRSEQITCMRAVPAMLRQLVALPAFRAEQLPSLRLIVNSSAPIDPLLYTELKGRFAGIEVMNSYGLTEASTCTVLPDAMALARPDSVGVPIAGVEMRVADEDGRTVADGEEGEICVRGEHVFAGYRGRPEATAAAFRDGWLLTGDLGHRDAEGYYYLHGRMDDVINCGGRKIVPEDVERCILQMLEVKEAAVAGYPHRILGQVAKAFVVEREPGGLDPKDVIRHCARQLASYQVPFHVEVVQELPRNSLGKVLRRKLAASAPQEALRNG